MKDFEFNIEPMGAPRMTRADAWKKRPVVLRYHEFRDEINRLLKNTDLSNISAVRVSFYLPMSESWSKKKKLIMCDAPHQQKPDIDNLTKALLDSMFRDGDDCRIYHIDARKYWAATGKIILTIDA